LFFSWFELFELILKLKNIYSRHHCLSATKSRISDVAKVQQSVKNELKKWQKFVQLSDTCT